jgi:D-arabinose 5-phosphate isomerase GutQ
MAEVADRTALKADLYVNLQSDEPLICPEDIDRLIFAMDEGSSIVVGTLAHPIPYNEADDPNIVKVVTNNWGDAMYFSRSLIPYSKGISMVGYFRHLGVYAYRAEALKEFASLPRGAAERAESLEQLRWLEKGGSIYVLKVDSCGPAVDTPDGARTVEKILTTRTQVQDTYTRVFLEQSAALSRMATFDPSKFAFRQAVELILTAKRRVILSGIGKSGIIAHKIAATLSSIGIPSLFVHPAEAKHGDLGMVHREDVAIIISQTGRTAETLWLTETLKNFGVKILAITGNANSIIGELADVVLETPVAQESIPGIPAPSVSTTLALVMGDALAAAVAQVKGVTAEDFARLHPANQK